MFNRKNAALAATILGGLIVAALLVATFNRIGTRTEETHNLTPSRVEMMPEGSPEFRRVHYTGPDGKDLKIEVAYRNGDYGYIFYRTDGTLREFLVLFPGGSMERKHSYFDPTGKIITGGFEVRKDGSKVWETQTVDSGLIKTVTYWQDGKSVFSEALRSVTDGKIEAKYFRRDGQLWVRSIVQATDATVVYEEDVYNEAGKLVRSRKTSDGYAGTVEYFREDGTLHYRQTFERSYGYGYGGYGRGYYEEDGGYYAPSPSASLKLVTVYAADGKTPTLELGMDYTKTVATWDNKGIKTVRYLYYDGTVSRVEYVSPNGSTTSNNKPTGDDAKVPSYNEADYKGDLPKPVDVVAEWKKAEEAPLAPTP